MSVLCYLYSFIGNERLHFHFSLSRIGEENGNPLQSSCLENPRDGAAWCAAIYGVAQSRTQLKWLSSSSSSIGNDKHKCVHPVERYTRTPIYMCIYVYMDFPSGSAVKNMSVMQEMQVQFLGPKDPLEKEMATQSSILAWEIPWIKEPGTLQSMGSQKSQTWFTD